jgi:hypothetical protein
LPTFVFTVIAGIATGVWAILQYRAERRKDRLVQTTRLAALYYNPFLLAAEELQSRLYNILCREGLGPLRQRSPEGDYAEETLYLVAQYFAYEPFVLRHTPDLRVIQLIQRIRDDFATDRDGIDAWCLFRPTQKELGRLILITQPGQDGFELDCIPLSAFRERLADPHRVETLRVNEALESLRNAKTANDLTDRTVMRWKDVQSGLVDLLVHLERELGRVRGSKSFSLFSGRREKSVNCR